jgi:hypothetical protein
MAWAIAATFLDGGFFRQRSSLGCKRTTVSGAMADDVRPQAVIFNALDFFTTSSVALSVLVAGNIGINSIWTKTLALLLAKFQRGV